MPDPAPSRFTPHLLVPWEPKTLTPRPSGSTWGGQFADRSADRQGHVDRLLDGLEEARQASTVDRGEVDAAERASGFAIRVEAADSYDLQVDSLANSGLTLMSVHEATGSSPQEAVIWIPDGRVQAFAEKISQFTQDTPSGKPKQQGAVANTERIQHALLDHLWQDDAPLPDMSEHRWWELWFDPGITETDQIAALQRIAAANGWPVADRSITIGDYRIAHVATTGTQLKTLLATNACPSEVRQPSFAEQIHTTARTLQRDLTLDLATRLKHAAADAPVVCILDTGIHQEHPLLKQALAGRAQSVFPHEGPDDNNGHGTKMAGLALLGDLADALESTGTITLAHGLESVKILPRQIRHDDTPRSHAEVTVNAIADAETGTVDQPHARVFSMAVTQRSTPERNGTDGRASLWSASLDALAAGTDIAVHDDRIELLGAPDLEASRLIVVSAGNVREHPLTHLRQDDGTLQHLALCDTSPIENPSQAWNVLTVGAYTDLAQPPQDAMFHGYRALAAAGELSPFSRTSVALPVSTPIKPDIVLEGGNLLVDADGTLTDEHDIVSLTTTHHGLDRPLTTANATSAATAQAARLAAIAHAAYPALTPETIRALLVHEARWTTAMTDGILNANGRRRTGKGNGSKHFARTVLRRYGWGVPTEERVLSSATNAVTLMIQGSLIPFRRDNGRVQLGELKLHQLPWPREQLLDLGATPVQLRVTLSYFVEPNPGRRGVMGQHTYASHRLRFAIKGSLENLSDFEGRVAKDAQAANDGMTTVGKFEGDKAWLVGSDNRNRGSLHADIWSGTAAELADCGALAVYPAGGWWKYNNRSDRVGRPVSYALLVSLTTPEVETDLYTATAVRLDVPIPTDLAARVETASGVPVQLPLGW
ncbi:S8 family peptidase [Kitasatospora sp. NPDC098652]|uniref:S8 family peptidase n=1 Tax=Kitasatospora sp. NPDC098652 TaxID=3364095 RepID=UPI00381E5A25